MVGWLTCIFHTGWNHQTYFLACVYICSVNKHTHIEFLFASKIRSLPSPGKDFIWPLLSGISDLQALHRKTALARRANETKSLSHRIRREVWVTVPMGPSLHPHWSIGQACCFNTKACWKGGDDVLKSVPHWLLGDWSRKSSVCPRSHEISSFGAALIFYSGWFFPWRNTLS